MVYADNAKSVDTTEHRLLIQISSDDIRAQETALGNIINLQKHYGMDYIETELIAFGPQDIECAHYRQESQALRFKRLLSRLV